MLHSTTLGAGALKVEGPIVQKRSIALEVTMATRQAPTTWHLHTERSQREYLPQPILTYLGVGGVGAKPADITGYE